MFRYIKIDDKNIILDAAEYTEDNSYIDLGYYIGGMIIGGVYDKESNEIIPAAVSFDPVIGEQEILQAEILKNQVLLEEKLEEQDIILAEILLNSLGGNENEQ